MRNGRAARQRGRQGHRFGGQTASDIGQEVKGSGADTTTTVASASVQADAAVEQLNLVEVDEAFASKQRQLTKETTAATDPLQAVNHGP